MTSPAPPAVFQGSADTLSALILKRRPQFRRRCIESICLRFGALAAPLVTFPASPAVFQGSADILRALIRKRKPQLHRRCVGGHMPEVRRARRATRDFPGFSRRFSKKRGHPARLNPEAQAAIPSALCRGICPRFSALAASCMTLPASPAVFQGSADTQRAVIRKRKPQLHRRYVGGICLRFGALAAPLVTPPASPAVFQGSANTQRAL